jgi:hypothetical protein
MNQYLNDLTDNNEKQIAEVNRNLCIASGYDNVKFVNPVIGLSGDLGMPLLKDYWHAPIFDSEGTGTLDETKYYAIWLVPFSTYIANPNTGEWMTGTPMHRSDIVKPSVAAKSLIFNLPAPSEDGFVFFAGDATGGNSVTLQDNTRSWVSDSLIGFRVLNIDTGLTAEITDNDSISITIDSDIGAITGSRYHIYKRKITGYQVYAASTSDPALIDAVTPTLQTTIDADELTIEIASVSTAGNPMLNLNFPPDPYKACVQADNMLICGGGVSDNTGEAEIDISPVAASASVATPIAVSTHFSYAIVAGTSYATNKIMRIALAAGESFGLPVAGSIISISGSEDSGNNIEDAIVTRADQSGNWIEIVNNDGVVNANDETMTISGVRNVLIGNSSGENKTSFTKGMIGSRFKFENDLDSYDIAWVDEINQLMGLRTKYIGLNGKFTTFDPRPTVAPRLIMDSSNQHIGQCLHCPSGAFDPSTYSGESYSFYVRRSAMISSPTQQVRLLDVGVLYTSHNFYFSYARADNRYILFRVDSGGSPYSYFPGTLFPDTDWIHFCLTFEYGAGARLYINGAEVTRSVQSGNVSSMTLSPANAKLTLGAGGITTNIAKCRIYGRTLSAAEAESDYNGGIISGLDKEWRCDEGSGVECAETGGGASLFGYVWSYNNKTPALASMTWDTFTYEAGGGVENDNEIRIESDRGIAWSDKGYPHVFRTENYTPSSDTVVALESFNQSLLVFCKNSLWKIPLQGLGSMTPYLLSDKVSCIAPHSVVSTPSGVFFYDGTGISMTDGQQIVPVTAYRANDFLGYINRSLAKNMQGVFDPNKRRIEYYFAYGDSQTNNMGLTISTDSMNCYPIQRVDVNAAWLDRDSTGDLMVYHGTTNEIGEGTIWAHDESVSTDGGYEQEIVGVITGITGSTLTCDFGAPIEELANIKPGAVFMFLPLASGTYFQFRIESITLPDVEEPNVYEVVVDSALDMTDFSLGGSVIAGGIPFDYGIKWTDFHGPQYRHKIRQLQIDVSDFNGILFVEHYANLIDSTPVFITSHFVNEGTTKIVSKNKAGDCYQYGFRLYGVSMTKFSFHSFEILFDVEA